MGQVLTLEEPLRAVFEIRYDYLLLSVITTNYFSSLKIRIENIRLSSEKLYALYFYNYRNNEV